MPKVEQMVPRWAPLRNKIDWAMSEFDERVLHTEHVVLINVRLQYFI